MKVPAGPAFACSAPSADIALLARRAKTCLDEPGDDAGARPGRARFGRTSGIKYTPCLIQKFALCNGPAVVAGRSPAPIVRTDPKGLHSRIGLHNARSIVMSCGPEVIAACY